MLYDQGTKASILNTCHIRSQNNDRLYPRCQASSTSYRGRTRQLQSSPSAFSARMSRNSWHFATKLAFARKSKEKCEHPKSDS